MQDAIEALVRFQFDSAGIKISTQDTQASRQMMTMNSCSAECLNKVQNSSDNHMVTSTCGEVYEYRALFLRILISRVVVNNRSNISYYSHQITCLDQLMTNINCDKTSFNYKVQKSLIGCSTMAKHLNT